MAMVHSEGGASPGVETSRHGDDATGGDHLRPGEPGRMARNACGRGTAPEIIKVRGGSQRWDGKVGGWDPSRQG